MVALNGPMTIKLYFTLEKMKWIDPIKYLGKILEIAKMEF